MNKNNKDKTITIRINAEMYAKIKTYDIRPSELIRKSVRQYFRLKEPNHKIYGSTNYNSDIIKILQDQIQDLKNDKNMLQQQNAYLSMPWYQRMFTPRLKQ